MDIIRKHENKGVAESTTSLPTRMPNPPRLRNLDAAPSCPHTLSCEVVFHSFTICIILLMLTFILINLILLS